MPERSEYPAGTFCWVGLATTDQEAAKSFYGALLGWSYEDVPTDVGNTYSLATIETKRVAAIYPLPGDSQGMPSHWVSYVSILSADEAAKRAADLGGTLLMEPFDVMTAGRMAVIKDPTGAVVAVWERKDHCGAALVNQHGAQCWNELMTKDTASASAFYTGLPGRRSPSAITTRCS